MNRRFEELVDYVDPPEQLTEPLSPDSQERILELTMKKINETESRRRMRKTFRRLTAAAVLILVLGVTSFAAVENGWFGIDRIFRGKLRMAGDGMTTDTPKEETPDKPRAENGPAAPEQEQDPDLILMPAPEQTEADTEVEEAENESYGFDCIFGEQVRLAEDGERVYDAQEESPVIPRTYNEQEQRIMAEGLMTDQKRAEVAETGVTASTEDYRFTLERMLGGEDVLFAIVRVEAQNEEAREYMANATGDWRTGNYFGITALANTGNNFREKEMNNGAMGMEPISVEGSVGYFFVSNTGRQFAEGDPILFEFTGEKKKAENIELFVVPLGPLMSSRAVVELDPAVYEGRGYRQETMTVTPVSLEVNGSYTESSDGRTPPVVITLKDGTSFELSSIENGFRHTPAGEYGCLYFSGTSSGPETGIMVMRDTWTFSKAVDLNQIETITVDGADYTLDLLQS